MPGKGFPYAYKTKFPPPVFADRRENEKRGQESENAVRMRGVGKADRLANAPWPAKTALYLRALSLLPAVPGALLNILFQPPGRPARIGADERVAFQRAHGVQMLLLLQACRHQTGADAHARLARVVCADQRSQIARVAREQCRRCAGRPVGTGRSPTGSRRSWPWPPPAWAVRFWPPAPAGSGTCPHALLRPALRLGRRAGSGRSPGILPPAAVLPSTGEVGLLQRSMPPPPQNTCPCPRGKSDCCGLARQCHSPPGWA